MWKISTVILAAICIWLVIHLFQLPAEREIFVVIPMNSTDHSAYFENMYNAPFFGIVADTSNRFSIEVPASSSPYITIEWPRMQYVTEYHAQFYDAVDAPYLEPITVTENRLRVNRSDFYTGKDYALVVVGQAHGEVSGMTQLHLKFE